MILSTEDPFFRTNSPRDVRFVVLLDDAERGFSKAGLELEFRDPCKYPTLVSMDSAKSNYSRLRIPFQRFSIQAAINGSTRGKLENRNL